MKIIHANDESEKNLIFEYIFIKKQLKIIIFQQITLSSISDTEQNNKVYDLKIY